MTITVSTSAHKPSAVILRFPQERRFAVRVERDTEDLGWFVVTYDREYGWLHGDFDAAHQDACVIARDYGVAVQSSAGWTVP